MAARSAILTAFCLTLAGQASAQSSAAPADSVPTVAEQGGLPVAPVGWAVQVGGGGLVFPDFLGSKTYRVLPLPSIDVGYGDLFSANVQDGARLNLIRSGGLRAGPIARFRFGQDERDNRQALRGLGNVGASVELGGFATYATGPFSTKLVVAQDVAGGHKGLVADLSAAYTTPVFGARAGPVLLSVGPSVTAVTSRFNRSYFGIDAGRAARSGLPVYRPGGGIESAGASLSLIAPLSPRFTVVAIAGYDRLLTDAADSPLVRLRGTPNQGTAGIFLTYKLF